MKKLLGMLLTLCVLLGVICLVSTTAFATEETTPVKLTEVNILVDELVPGQALPTPSVPDGAPYTITQWYWELHKPSNSVSSIGPKERVTDCQTNNRYQLFVRVEPIDGYEVSNSYTEGMINGSIEPDGTNQVVYVGSYDISHTWSLRTVIDRVELNYELPPAGSPFSSFSLTYDTSKITVGNIDISGNGPTATTFSDYYVHYAIPEIFVADGYEFSEDVVFIVNGMETEKRRNRWDACTLELYLDYNRTVSFVEFPVWPETASPGPGGTTELTAPEGASYTLTSLWMDLRTGEAVETLAAGNVYTLAYVAVPNTGFHFTEETTAALGGAPVEWAGDEQYMVVYKTYDLGARKIDRVDLVLPQLKKGCTPGLVTAAPDALYSVMETLWGESTTGSFEDAVPVQTVGFGTSVYAVPVLTAADGYAFAEDVKLFFNGQEVAVEYVYSMGSVIELAGLYGTLTPPDVDGWYEEDNTWVYYQNGEKLVSRWVKDSAGWVYLDENGLMLKNAWAKDSVGWCYMNEKGYMTKAQWVHDGNGWYYLDGRGYMLSSCWKKDSKGWVYLGKDGKMVINSWQRDSKGWCFLGADGYMVKNTWATDSVGFCRLDANGHMICNSWVHDGTGWAYVDAKGYAMVAGWKRDSKGWCYISGYYMVYDCWVEDDGDYYRIGSGGYMLTSQWVYDGAGWSYVNGEGKVPFNSWVKDSKGTCYIGEGGYMLTSSWITIDGKRYYVDENGYMLRNTTRSFTTGYYVTQYYKFDSNGVATAYMPGL